MMAFIILLDKHSIFRGSVVSCLFFLQVLRNSHQIEWERKLSVLNSQPVLKHWASIETRSTVTHTKLREYPPNAVSSYSMQGAQ